MRLSRITTAALLSTALAVPLTAPAFASSASAAVAVSTTGDHSVSTRDRALQQALDSITAAGAPGVIAEVRDVKQGVWSGSSGTADLDHQRPLSVHGRFRAGSVTKSFVATTVLQLVAGKKVDLDTTVENYLPGIVPNGKNITVRMLLNHRSGLFNYTEALWPGGFKEMYGTRFKTWTNEQLLKVAFDHGPYFAPNAAGRYSNTNYILLGMLIEKVTGHTAESEMTQRILKPLGMHHTSFPDTSPVIPGPHAHGYMHLDGPASPYVDFTANNMTWAGTAGEIISTTTDLNRYFKALLGGELLPQQLLREMQTSGDKLEDGDFYGLGMVRIQTPAFGTVYGHTGGALGYNTFTFVTADNSRQVTMSVSTLPDTAELNTVVNNALKVLLTRTALVR
jgi:D-alanyl-D-alanine carboxypeptidase